MKKNEQTKLLSQMLKCGGKCFKYIDVYSPNKKDVVAVVFFNDKKFMDKLEKIK